MVSHSRFEKTVLRGILVKVGKTNKVTVTLRTGGRIHGSVRSGGAPLAGALVRASGLEGEFFQRAASNDVQGQFEIRGLSSGEYTVSGNLAAPETRNTGTRNPARLTQESFSESRAALLDLGQFQEALECSNRAIGLKPDYADAWGNKGIALCGLSNSLRSGGRACRMVDPILTTPMERTIPRSYE